MNDMGTKFLQTNDKLLIFKFRENDTFVGNFHGN